MEEGKRRGASTLLAPAAAVVIVAGFYAAQQASAGRTHRALLVVALLLSAAIVAILIRVPRTRWALPAIIPLLIAAALGSILFSRGAVVPAAIGFVLMVALAAGADVERWLAAVFDPLARGLAAGLGWIAFCLTILPAWAWTRLRRRDPLVSAATPGSMWVSLDSATSSGDPTALGAGGDLVTGGRSFTGKISWSIGCICLLLGVNYGLGWAWNQVAADPADSAATSGGGSNNSEVSRDPRNDVAAMAAYPWREEYFEDIQRTSGGYWPFTEYRPADFASPYVNQDDWIRKSYEPAGDPATMPVAWMFGGSTTWGEGQRDDWTIASWLARISEEEGIPLRVMNHGQRGWTHFQEMVLYEQRLNLVDKPDFAIFYDGANEITAQTLLTEGVPTHTLTYGYAQKLAGSTVATELVQRPQSDTLAQDVWAKYQENSAMHLLADALRSSPAGAAPNRPAQSDLGEGIDADQQDNGEGTVYEYDLQPEDGTDAGQVYERGKQFTMLVSDTHDVEAFYFWQPMRIRTEPIELALAELTDPTIDISRSLEDHDDVFIDGGHTNEEGARIVAEEIWISLEPAVRAWYEENA